MAQRRVQPWPQIYSIHPVLAPGARNAKKSEGHRQHFAVQLTLAAFGLQGRSMSMDGWKEQKVEKEKKRYRKRQKKCG